MNFERLAVIQRTKVYHLLWYWLPTLAYCIFIFTLSSSPQPFPTPSFYGGDKLFHSMEYIVLGFLLARSIFNSKPRFSNSFLIILAVALATLYGISDEIHQAFVPGRSANLWDISADGFGSLIGTFCYTKIKSLTP